MKHKTRKIFYIIFVLVLISGGVYWLISKNVNNRSHAEQISANIYEYRDETISSEDLANIYPVRESSSNGVKTYSNPKYNFSFKYPEGFTVANFQEGEYGETILVRKEPASPELQRGEQTSFQIFISPFDEPGPLTKERVLKDLPDMKIENAENRILKNGVPGLIFFIEEPSLGKTREVWFIHNGYLYQVSTYAELDKWLATILSTWRFQ